MVEQEVKKINTPVSEAEMSRALLDAAKELFGITLNKNQLSLIVAQNNLETGSRKYMWNYNVGNITHVPGDGFNYWSGLDWLYDYMPDASGFTKEQKRTIKLKYRAYPSLEAGVKDYLSFLKRKGHGAIWDKILAADPVAFSKELKKNKYYTAHEEDYTKGIVSQMNAYNKRNSYENAVAGNFNSNPNPNSNNPQPKQNLLSRLDKLLNSLMSALASDDPKQSFIKKSLYKKYLLPNTYLIRIKAQETEDAVEFARILRLAINEELQGDAETYMQQDNVEVECTIHGPKSLSTQALVQLCDALSDTFEKATKKIGGCKVSSVICPNKISHYQELDIKMAQKYYNIFHFKFIK
jgi:hypothetical protein